MASLEAQRQERTPSTVSTLLGLVRDTNGTWSVAGMPSENREATMNDRSAMLVQAGLKQRKSDVVTALASARGSSLHAVRWIIDSKNCYESLIQRHDLPALSTLPALRYMAIPALGYMAVRLRHRENGYMAVRLRQRFPALRLFAACLSLPSATWL